MRDTWTDERLDDLAASLRPMPAQVGKIAAAVEHLTEETRALRTETGFLRTDMGSLRTELTGETRTLIGWMLSASLLGTVVALITVLAS